MTTDSKKSEEPIKQPQIYDVVVTGLDGKKETIIVIRPADSSLPAITLRPTLAWKLRAIIVLERLWAMQPATERNLTESLIAFLFGDDEQLTQAYLSLDEGSAEGNAMKAELSSLVARRIELWAQRGDLQQLVKRVNAPLADLQVEAPNVTTKTAEA